MQIGGSVMHTVFGDVWIYDIEDDSWEQAVLGCALPTLFHAAAV